MDKSQEMDKQEVKQVAREESKKQQEEKKGEKLDPVHNPPTDRETLTHPEALDDLADLRHLEL